MRKAVCLAIFAAVIAATAALAQGNHDGTSGAQVQGLPGNKSGPAVSPSEQTPSQKSGPSQDWSGAKGLRGNKSGPAQPPPKQ